MSDVRCGWVPPEPHQVARARDLAHPDARYSILRGTAEPQFVVLGGLLPKEVLDQGALGSCTANMWANLLYMAMTKQGLPAFIASRLAIYFGERQLEGSEGTDSGAAIADGAYHLARMGFCGESLWPYDISVFTHRPGPEVDTQSYARRGETGLNYHPVLSTGSQLIDDVRSAILAGFGVGFGCPVTEQFCSTKPDGVIHAPTRLDIIAGGHAEVVVGYDDANQCFIIQNSWGWQWGDANPNLPPLPPGCWRMGYDYFTSPAFGASDIWLVSQVPEGSTP